MSNEAASNNEATGKEVTVKKDAKEKRNKVNARLLQLIGSETDPQKIAFIVSKFNQQEAKERERKQARKALVKYLKIAQSKVNPDKMDDLAFEFAKAKSGDFREWLRANHSELFEVNKLETATVSEA